MKEENKKYLLSFGYSESQINRINKKNNNASKDPSRSKDAILALLCMGFNKKEIIELTSAEPSILTYGGLIIAKRVERLIITLRIPVAEFVKVALKCPSIILYKTSTITNRIKYFMKMGITKSSAIKAITLFPQLITLSEENIEDKKDLLTKNGYSKEDINYLIIKTPGVMCMSEENLSEKFRFYTKIGILDKIIEVPSFLIQSVELSKARFEFFKTHDIKLEGKSISRLFMGQKDFESKYKLSNKDVIEKYGSKKGVNEHGYSN